MHKSFGRKLHKSSGRDQISPGKCKTANNNRNFKKGCNYDDMKCTFEKIKTSLGIENTLTREAFLTLHSYQD
jgi:hypothetical protein